MSELKPLKNLEVAFNTTTEQEQVIAEDSEGNCYGFDSWEEVYLKSEADKVIAELEKSHKKEVGQLLMKISELEKLVETADKLLKQRGGFTVKDITFNGVKLEGLEKEGV